MTATAPSHRGRARRRAPALALGCALLAAGCGAPPAGGTADPAGAGGLSATDLAWAQLMIPVDELLLPFLDTLAERADDPALRALGAGLVPDYQAELEALHGLLTEAGVAYRNPHVGHDMPGMVTEEERDELLGLTGGDFDEAALAHLVEHLTRTAEVSRAQTAAGTDPAAVALAEELVLARDRHRAELDRRTP
ncbi:DUF305 domain-containing protein [Streptomyces sp. DSM 44915]|uniref:DUF305 domain-containing protein n=1 Tax=Streptomyces chisholmiae TaxID=3075540 RepID=A0ABU2JIY7_9ACTN|nr:DUF305 domain-containing protein [Streptomyces sp. DSM 44915]MDT0264955.1 DUF305 domain-containing protein [Streptomyces sp. DSM 44915]